MTTAPAPTARPTLTVEIWSDLICPWCWIGKRRFDEALAAFAHADRVDVALRAYRLMPGQPVEPVEAMLAGKYRMSPAQVDQMLRQVSDAAASVGLRYDLPGTLVGDTLDGHRLVKLAEATGRAHADRAAVPRVFLRARLAVRSRRADRISGRSGAERSAVEAVLRSDLYRAEVEADAARAAQIGGRGVPLFVFGGRYAVSGAQPADAFAQALGQGMARRHRRTRRRRRSRVRPRWLRTAGALVTPVASVLTRVPPGRATIAAATNRQEARAEGLQCSLSNNYQKAASPDPRDSRREALVRADRPLPRRADDRARQHDRERCTAVDQHRPPFHQTALVWVVNAYLLTFGGCLLLGGRLGDLYGQRHVFLAGLVVFTLASLACGLAQSQRC